MGIHERLYHEKPKPGKMDGSLVSIQLEHGRNLVDAIMKRQVSISRTKKGRDVKPLPLPWISVIMIWIKPNRFQKIENFFFPVIVVFV